MPRSLYADALRWLVANTDTSWCLTAGAVAPDCAQMLADVHGLTDEQVRCDLVAARVRWPGVHTRKNEVA